MRIALALLLLIAVGGFYWCGQPADTGRQGHFTPGLAIGPGEAPDAGVSHPRTGDLDGEVIPRPDHPYRDTDVDGDVTLDQNGHFRPDRNALRLFDYFFIESGRLSDQAILQQIQDWLASRLAEPALSEALGFLDQYLRLRQLAAEAYAAGAMPDDPADRLELIRSLQAQAFGPELAQQLYGEEYRRQRLQLERMLAAARGEDFDPTAGLSAAESRVYQRTQSVIDAAELAEETDDPEELWDQRAEAFGYDAAYRLDELDQRRQLWEARLTAYRQQKQALLAEAGLTDSERERRQAELLDEHFDATERLRVQALERIAATEAESD